MDHDDVARDCAGRPMRVGQVVKVLDLAHMDGERWTPYELSQTGLLLPITGLSGRTVQHAKAPPSHAGTFHVVTLQGQATVARSAESISVYSWQLEVLGTGLKGLINRYKEQEAAHG